VEIRGKVEVRDVTCSATCNIMPCVRNQELLPACSLPWTVSSDRKFSLLTKQTGDNTYFKNCRYGKHGTKGKKLVTKDHMLSDSIYRNVQDR
jgi:hypothetical protein